METIDIPDYSGDEIRNKIKSAIKRYGNNAEHNIYHYLNSKTAGTENILFDFGNDKVILASYAKSSNNWSLFPSGVLSPQEEKVDLLLKFCLYCLYQKIGKKVIMEVEEMLFQELKDNLKSNLHYKMKISVVNCIYQWPIINLNFWNPNLNGKLWKGLRNIKNNFFKNNSVEIIESNNIQKNILKEIVAKWKLNRKDKDKAYYKEYINLIENWLADTDYSMSICINGKPSSLAAGWQVPNSKSFYLSVMLHNYKVKGLGEVMYLEAIKDLKNRGFDSVNLGGTWGNLLFFKEKFRPHHGYRTFEFSIIKV